VSELDRAAMLRGLYPELDPETFERAIRARLDRRPGRPESASEGTIRTWALDDLEARGRELYPGRSLDDDIGMGEAAAIAGVTASQLRRLADTGRLAEVRRTGRGGRRGGWRITRRAALEYRERKRGAGRPAVVPLDVEHQDDGERPWRARVAGGPWAYSTTRDGAVRAARAADRKRRLIERHRAAMRAWHGAPRAGLLGEGDPSIPAAGARVVVRGRRQWHRGIVLEASRGGRVTVGYVASADPAVPVTVAVVSVFDVRTELGRRNGEA